MNMETALKGTVCKIMPSCGQILDFVDRPSTEFASSGLHKQAWIPSLPCTSLVFFWGHRKSIYMSSQCARGPKFGVGVSYGILMNLHMVLSLSGKVNLWSYVIEWVQ